MIKKMLWPLLVAAFILAPGRTASALVISLDPSTQTVAPGAGLAVDLNISGLGLGSAPSLGAWDVDIGFDTSILSFTGASFGNQLDLFGLGSINGAFDLGGVLDIFEISLDLPADLDLLQADAFTLATLSFDALSVGMSALTLSIDELADSLGDPLVPSQVLGAIVTVRQPVIPVPEPGTLALFVVGLAGLTVLQRRSLRAARKRTRA